MVQKRRHQEQTEQVEKKAKKKYVVPIWLCLNILIWGSAFYLWSQERDAPPLRNPIFAANEIHFEARREAIIFNDEAVLSFSDVDVDILSDYAVLANLSTGEIIFDYRGSNRAYPASITKIMTVLVGLEYSTSDEVVVQFDLNELYLAGSTMTGFMNGEIRTLSEILHGAMLTSGGDATASLAHHVAGSYEDFVELMNATARRLGMHNTHFMNTSGLHHVNHYTTARDTAILLEYALNNRQFERIFTAPTYTFTNSEGSQQIMRSTMFRNLEEPIINGGEILGGKVGFTTPAGLCLASFATDGVYDFVLITFSAPSGEVPPAHLQDAVNIYEYFFNFE